MRRTRGLPPSADARLNRVKDFLTENAVALVALVISLALAWFEVASRWTNRQRTTLELHEFIAFDSDDGNHRYLKVTIRHLGRPVSLESITFIEADDPDRSLMWSEPPLTAPVPFVERATRIEDAQAVGLVDGTSLWWDYVVERFDDDPNAPQPFRLYAEAEPVEQESDQERGLSLLADATRP